MVKHTHIQERHVLSRIRTNNFNTSVFILCYLRRKPRVYHYTLVDISSSFPCVFISLLNVLLSTIVFLSLSSSQLCFMHFTFVICNKDLLTYLKPDWRGSALGWLNPRNAVEVKSLGQGQDLQGQGLGVEAICK